MTTTATRPPGGSADGTEDPTATPRLAPTTGRTVRIRTGGLATTLWTLAPLVVGAAVLSAGWDGWPAFASLLLAALLPVLVIPAVARARVSPWTAAVILVLATVAWAYLASRSAANASASVLLDAIPRLLTAPFPAMTRPDLLAPGILVTVVVGSFVGVRLARPRRRQVSPVVAGTLLYAGGLLLTAGRADPHGVAALALVVVSVAGWVLTPDAAPSPTSLDSESRQSTPRTRGVNRPDSESSGPPAPAPRIRGGLGRALPVLLLLGAVTLAAAAPSRDATFDPRELVTPPQQDITALSPLPQLAAWGRDPARALFTVSGDVYPLHLVTLTDYDGASWTAPSRYQSLGGTDRSSLPAGPRRSRITAEVSRLTVDGPWVPAPGQPTDVSDSGAVVDAETGSLVIADRPVGGDGVAYEVTGYVDAPDEATLAAAQVPTRDDPRVQRYLGVPGIPSTLADYATAVTRGATTPLAKALAIEGAVRASRTVSAKAPTGSSYRRIQAFLFSDKATPDGQAGTSEQFASSFAVLARWVGLPTRLVTGFLPGTPAADGRRAVTGRDALAWPEVYFTGAGWVPFSPTPDTGRFGPDLQDRTPIGSAPSTSGPPVATPSSAGNAPVVVVEAASRPSGPPVVVIVAVAVVLVVLATLLLLYTARRSRRRRHREAGAPGAWAQLLDVVRIRGDDLALGRGATDLAAALDAVPAGSGPPAPGRPPESATAPPGPARRVAEAAERQAFGPAAGTATRTARRGTDPVWRDVEVVERAVRAELPRWRRCLWAVDPRPLRADRAVAARREALLQAARRNVPDDRAWTSPGAVGQDDSRATGTRGRR